MILQFDFAGHRVIEAPDPGLKALDGVVIPDAIEFRTSRAQPIEQAGDGGFAESAAILDTELRDEPSTLHLPIGHQHPDRRIGEHQ